MTYEEIFKSLGFTWDKESRSAKSGNDEIKPISSLVGIELRNGSEKEIRAALRLISNFKWKKLYCSGDKDFLSRVMSRVIENHSKDYSFLEQVTAKFRKDKARGFSDSDDWSPTPRPKHEQRHGQDHDEDHGHSGP